MRDEIEQYLARGFTIFPVEYGSKKASISDWQTPTRRWTPDEFPLLTNIALRLDAVVDIDADNAYARRLCSALLFKALPTTARYGRPSVGLPTHYLFFSSGPIQPLKIVDDDGTIIEIRNGTSMYSIAPPSKLNATDSKPEDILAWMSPDQTIATVAPELLTLVVKTIGTISLLARYWPSPGRRHEAVAAVAGLLCRILPASLLDTEGDLLTMIGEAAALAKDVEQKDRTAYVRRTYVRWKADEPTRGGPWLQRNGSERLVELLYDLWDYHGDQRYVDELNEQYAVVHMQGGAVRVLCETEEKDDFLLRYTKLNEFPKLFTEKVQVGTTKAGVPIEKPIGQVWLEHPRRRFFSGIELAPNPDLANAGYYNLWRGFRVEPKQGDWSLFRQHLDLVANHDPEHAAFIFNWMAETVQHPERPIGVAVAFRGLQGTGKSTFAKWFGMLFGPHFLHLDSEGRITHNFNAHLQNKIVVLADEAIWAGGKQGLGALKRLVTETTLNIEPKHVDMFTVKNMIHMMIASNEEWLVPAGWDDRRFAVFDTSEQHKNDKKFFHAVYQQLVQGGWAALLYDLQHHHVDIDFTDLPKTKARRDQQMQTADFEQEWWFEVLRQGKIGEGWTEASDNMGEVYDYEREEIDEYGQATMVLDLEWPHHILKSRMNEEGYLVFMDNYHRMSRKKLTDSMLGAFINQHTPLTTTRKNATGKRYWVVPPLDVCRAHWAKTHKVVNTPELWNPETEPKLIRVDEEEELL